MEMCVMEQLLGSNMQRHEGLCYSPQLDITCDGSLSLSPQGISPPVTQTLVWAPPTLAAGLVMWLTLANRRSGKVI